MRSARQPEAVLGPVGGTALRRESRPDSAERGRAWLILLFSDDLAAEVRTAPGRREAARAWR